MGFLRFSDKMCLHPEYFIMKEDHALRHVERAGSSGSVTYTKDGMVYRALLIYSTFGCAAEAVSAAETALEAKTIHVKRKRKGKTSNCFCCLEVLI